MIRKLPGQRLWRVYGRTGRIFGTYPSRERAERRLAQIEWFRRSV